MLEVAEAVPGRSPESVQTTTERSPGGRVNGSTGRPCRAPSMMSCQIGAAPVTPETSRMGPLSALPTQTPTAREGV